MISRRLFEYILAMFVVVMLLWVFGHHVLATSRLLAGSQLTTGYHAMMTSGLLIRVHCQVHMELKCGEGYRESFVQRGSSRIRMFEGYPAPSADGIILAAGLQTGVYSVVYYTGGLFVYLTGQQGELGCRVGYRLPEEGQSEAELLLNIENCG